MLGEGQTLWVHLRRAAHRCVLSERRCCHEKLLTVFSRIRALVLRSSRTVNHNLEFRFCSNLHLHLTWTRAADALLSGKLRSVRHFGVGELHLVTPADLWDRLLYVKGTGITFFCFSKEMKRDYVWTDCILCSVYYILPTVLIKWHVKRYAIIKALSNSMQHYSHMTGKIDEGPLNYWKVMYTWGVYSAWLQSFETLFRCIISSCWFGQCFCLGVVDIPGTTS